jgi:ABC-type phosphate transport system substrate-binding protein
MFIKDILKLLLLVGALISSFAAHSINIITHPSVNVDTLTTAQLRRIYSMRQTLWADHSAIVVFVLPSKHKLHRAFAKKILRMFPYQLDRIWNKLTYSGVGAVPIVVDSPQALLNAVVATPGAIGYMEDDLNKNKLHIIKIKG